MSTTSFVSSTGDCRMIGETEHDKKVFLANNFEKMQDDFARGNGEYASSFAKMHGCSGQAQRHYTILMKRNFDKIPESDSFENYESIYQFLENHFQSDPFLRSNCKASNNEV